MNLGKRCLILLPGAVLFAAAAYGQGTCLQNEYTASGQSQTLNCTANDVRVAQVVNVRDMNGNPLTTCIEGTTFSFLADFEIVTSSTSSRSNIGLYFASQGQASALTGTCVDNIIAPLHQCPGAAAGIQCGSDNYHELDGTSADNCGDTSSGDRSSVFGTAAEGVTVVVSNFLCHAPAGSATLQMPNCTSWQVPGKTLNCSSPSPNFPYEINAIPGSPSKCNCGVLPLPITPVTPTVTVSKSCSTTQTPGPATSCNVGNGTTTESDPATYNVSIANTTGTSGITVDQICDSWFGNIFTAAGFSGTPCAPANSNNHQTITSNNCGPLDIPATNPVSTGTCSFTVSGQPEATTVTDTVSVTGHADLNTSRTFGPSTSNSVSVTSTEVPSTATITKGVVSTTAACATVRYSVDVANTSGVDETLSVSALTDSAYGDITKLGTATAPTILGTTCGVTAGLGTLATATAAGLLPASLPVGGAHYKCQFDAQFCSALDANSCISNVDSVSGTFAGDEAADKVTVTANTITVKECLATTVTSQ